MAALEDGSIGPKGQMSGAALNLEGSHALFGRNWGCRPDREVKGLHYECCYYAAIDYAIKTGLPRVEAGAQGDHKVSRGYMPVLTYSAHYLADERLAGAVSTFLEQEAWQTNRLLEAIRMEASPFKDPQAVGS